MPIVMSQSVALPGGVASPFTWNPADAGANTTFASSNRNYTGNTAGAGNFRSVRAITSKTSGKWYCEITIAAQVNGTDLGMGVGIGKSDFDVNSYPGATTTSAMYYFLNRAGFVAGITEAQSQGTLNAALNDVWGLAMDLNAGKAWLAQNNSWASGSPAAGTTPWLTWTPDAGPWFFVCMDNGDLAITGTLRLAATAAFSAPAGFTLINA